MKELVSLALGFDLRGLLVTPTSNVVIQTFRGLFVAALAFIADFGVMWLATLAGIHYLVGHTIGFMIGVVVNYVLSVRFVFKEKAPICKTGEFSVYALVGLGGWGISTGMMWYLTEIVGLFYMVSKIFSTVVSFIWNFTVRKVTLYSNRSAHKQTVNIENVEEVGADSTVEQKEGGLL